MAEKAMFRAKKYENRKGEKKLNVSGDQSAFVKLAKDDEKAVEAFKQALVAGLKEKQAAKDDDDE